MRIAIWLTATCMVALAMPARAESPDCGLFPDTRSRLTCYDNVSRAPNEAPAATAHPAAARAKATKRHRKRR